MSKITHEVWPLTKIKPYPKNARVHPKSQIELLARLFENHGVDQPIVVDEEGEIIKGHGRYEAAKLAGFKEFPVIVRTGLTPEQKSVIRISDNQVGLLSSWDDVLLAEEVAELHFDDEELSLLGFSDAKLDHFAQLLDPDSIVASAKPQLQGLKYSVIVECADEAQQTEYINDFLSRGLQCRALIS